MLKNLWQQCDGPSHGVKNPCSWSCKLSFKEDTLREGEWVCIVAKVWNEPARYLTSWGGGGGAVLNRALNSC